MKVKPHRWGRVTKAIHAGEETLPRTGPLIPPIYQNSTFRFASSDECVDAFSDESSDHVYTRWGNPTQSVLEAKIAALEESEAALATASGMAAISTALLTRLGHGDHVVAMDSLYSATHNLLYEDLPRVGIETTFVDGTDTNQIEQALRANTKALYIESPANPTLKLVDIRACVKIARLHGITTIIDNTFASPCGQQPIKLGIDVVVHSMTKYMSGNGTVIAGAIAASAPFIESARIRVLRNFGGVISPFNAWLTLHGLATLPLRFVRHCENAFRVARFLESHPAIEWVRYPGLHSHPQHKLAKRQMQSFGGMIAFELKGGVEAGKRLVNGTQLCALAVSLGDVRTLICHPASTTHLHIPAEARKQSGISDGLVRLSVGLEDAEDIIADLDQGLP
ncbi:MAG: aminotransferase class I/II-fold pyridoxal phosphate-dependent enzyme [Candidatus Poribacteria bacterium]|nr:aminotransferase class I/II-fold pyridoxal phosphate-dependent enzyme [Candidatus Poribacteria bacterium]MDE0502933.1 aminotransferase class I/II-fold pyridoxal phosphate-dependent enzyme [Candidatus Poribacteria bacterium]